MIDYLSLDVEGGEMDVLRAFPWAEYTVALLTVETNDDAAKETELRAYMAEQGYTFLGHAADDDYFAWRPAGSAASAFHPPLDYCDPDEHATTPRGRGLRREVWSP